MSLLWVILCYFVKCDHKACVPALEGCTVAQLLSEQLSKRRNKQPSDELETWPSCLFPQGHTKVKRPGECCDQCAAAKGSCLHEGSVHYHGDMWNSTGCDFCTCSRGQVLCQKAECAQVECPQVSSKQKPTETFRPSGSHMTDQSKRPKIINCWNEYGVELGLTCRMLKLQKKPEQTFRKVMFLCHLIKFP